MRNMLAWFELNRIDEIDHCIKMADGWEIGKKEECEMGKSYLKDSRWDFGLLRFSLWDGFQSVRWVSECDVGFLMVSILLSCSTRGLVK